MNVCTAFDSKYFEPALFESFQITKFQYLSENCDGAKHQRELSFVRYKRQFKRKWDGSSLIYPQTHLESVITLDQNRSYLSELQLRRNFAYKTLGLLSPTKKWAGILASTTLRLRLILKASNVLVFLVSLSRLFQRFMADGMNEDWYNDKRHLGTV
jgi:hypothetical protein